MRRSLPTAALAAIAGLALPVLAQPCDPGWSPVGGGLPNSPAICLTTFDSGTGLSLYAGTVSSPGSPVKRWNGSAWSNVGQLQGETSALVVFNDGSGPKLHAAGRFTLNGTIHAVARFDGTTWQPLGLGLANSSGTLRGNTAAVFDDGSGPALFVGGYFTSAGGIPACGLARWSGQQWASVVPECLEAVTALKAIALSGQNQLLVAGYFTHIGGAAATNLASWDGSTWVALGDSSPNYLVYAFEQFDDGSGPAIFTAGNIQGVWKWGNGVGTRYCPAFTGQGLGALEVFDDGSGPALYVGGLVGNQQPLSWHGVAKLSPSQWFPLHGGISGSSSYVNEVFALQAADLGAGPSLYVAGVIPLAGNVVANNIARWGCGPCYSNCDNSTTAPLLNVNDFICFQNRFAAFDAYANCDHSTSPPTLNVADFICFMNKAAAGCP